MRSLLWVVIVLCLVFWLLGSFVWAAGSIIHLLLVVIVIGILLDVIGGRSSWW